MASCARAKHPQRCTAASAAQACIPFVTSGKHPLSKCASAKSFAGAGRRRHAMTVVGAAAASTDPHAQQTCHGDGVRSSSTTRARCTRPATMRKKSRTVGGHVAERIECVGKPLGGNTADMAHPKYETTKLAHSIDTRARRTVNVLPVSRVWWLVWHARVRLPLAWCDWLSLGSHCFLRTSASLGQVPHSKGRPLLQLEMAAPCALQGR